VLAVGLTVAMSALILTGGPLARAQEPVELTFMNWFYGGVMKEAYDEYIASYLAEHPEVSNIKVETHPYVRYNDVLNVKLAGNQPPDISWINASVGEQYVDSGRLLDLTPYIEAVPDFDLADFGDAALEPWKDGDALVGLPFTNAGNVVFYNEAIFEQAGVPTPLELLEKGEWTWDNLKTTAKAIKDSGAAQYGFVHNNNPFVNGFRTLVEIYGPYGASPWSEDGTTCTFDSPEMVAATQVFHDMIFTDRSHPGPDEQWDFAAGDIGMAMGRTDQIGARLVDAAFDWDVVPPPSGPKGFVPSRAQNGLVAWADSPNADLAAQFVVHTLTKENAAKFKASPSARRSLDNIDAISAQIPALSREQLERSIIPVLEAEEFVFEYSHPNYAPIERNANLVYDGQVWVEGADLQAALTEVCKAVQPLMAP
jgi:multiple sugar transport system substrate-binding protein